MRPAPSAVIALASLSLLACQPRQPALPPVLYLRQQLPSGEASFGRVNPSAVDLGTVLPEPPPRPEDRSCGDVVAFAFEPGLDPQARYQVDEILVRLWWYGGAGRGAAALVLPEEQQILDQVPVATTEETTRPEWERYALLLHRFELGRELSGAQLNSMFLTLDSSNAAVRIATCPALRSLVLFNPPSDVELDRMDRDGDGMSDGEELREGRDPTQQDPAAEPCLVPVGTVRLVEEPALPTLPPRGGLLPDPHIQDERRVVGEVLHHYGDLTVSGTLSLEDSWLILEPDPLTEQPPTLWVRPGASLTLQGGGLASPDPRWGFHVNAMEGSTLRIQDSTLLHGGFLQLQPSGHPSPTAAALLIQAEEAEIVGNTFAGNLLAVVDQGVRTRIEGNRFLRNGTALWSDGEDGLLRGNTSVGDGTFVRLDGRASGWRIEENTVSRWIETAIVLGPSQRPHQVLDNRLREGNRPLGLPHQGAAHEVRGNLFESCWEPKLLQQENTAAHRLEDNRWAKSAYEGCP
jgi:hypothetical protein